MFVLVSCAGYCDECDIDEQKINYLQNSVHSHEGLWSHFTELSLSFHNEYN